VLLGRLHRDTDAKRQDEHKKEVKRHGRTIGKRPTEEIVCVSDMYAKFIFTCHTHSSYIYFGFQEGDIERGCVSTVYEYEYQKTEKIFP
jgi:hypothetical protein